VDSVDGGKTFRIPALARNGVEMSGLLVDRENAKALRDMLTDALERGEGS
jgi:hypothetical protein